MLKALPLVALLAATSALTAAARSPSVEERARIEATLRAEGYATWGEIALEDEDWEVAGAKRAASPEECDVTIDGQTYQVLETEWNRS